MMSNLRINRGGAGDVETFAMANCLMILSSQTAAAAAATTDSHSSAAATTDFTRMFACKTCGKKFSSFQALGGHRASHKKIKPSLPSADGKPSSPPKPKTHVCTICSAEFNIGQALGGHMRRHRPVLPAGDGAGVTAAGSTITTEDSTEKSDGNNNSSGEKKRKSDGNNDDNGVVKLTKTSSCKRVGLDLNLDLNLNVDPSYCGKLEIIYHEKDEDEVEEGEIVEQADEDEEKDFLKLELRPPTINW